MFQFVLHALLVTRIKKVDRDVEIKAAKSGRSGKIWSKRNSSIFMTIGVSNQIPEAAKFRFRIIVPLQNYSATSKK